MKAVAKPAAAKKPAAKKVAANVVPTKNVARTKKSVLVKKVAANELAPAVVSGAAAKPAVVKLGCTATLKKPTDSLRKMGDKRTTEPVSLWRSPKSFLDVGATEETVEVALARLIEAGMAKVDSVKVLRSRCLMRRPGPRLPRFESLTHLTLRAVEMRALTQLLPGPGGPWRLAVSVPAQD